MLCKCFASDFHVLAEFVDAGDAEDEDSEKEKGRGLGDFVLTCRACGNCLFSAAAAAVALNRGLLLCHMSLETKAGNSVQLERALMVVEKLESAPRCKFDG